MSNDSWTAVLPVDDVHAQEPSVAHVNGAEIALYNVDGEYFATSNICTHGMVRLSDGYLDGYLIECPMHQGLFDVRTGRCAGDPVEIDLASFDVRVTDGMIEVRSRS